LNTKSRTAAYTSSANIPQTQKGSAYPRATTNGGASLDGSVTALHRFVRQYILGSTLSSATGSAKSIREQDRPGAVPRPFNRAA
jgi:hypothetical protein